MEGSELRVSLKDTAARGREILEIVRSLVEAIEAGCSDIERLLAAGKIHEIEQVFSRARDAYDAILQSDEGHLEAIARLALVHLKSFERTRGLAIAKELVGKAPDFKFLDISGKPRSAQTVLGDACRDNGDSEGARKAYEAALELEPADGHAAVQLSQIYVDQNKVEKAAKIAERFLAEGHRSTFQSTNRLLSNDPHRLPAIAGIITDYSKYIAKHV